VLQHFGNCCFLVLTELADEIDINRDAGMPLVKQIAANVVGT